MASCRRSSSKSQLMCSRKCRAIYLGSKIFLVITVNSSTSAFSNQDSTRVELSNPGTKYLVRQVHAQSSSATTSSVSLLTQQTGDLSGLPSVKQKVLNMEMGPRQWQSMRQSLCFLSKKNLVSLTVWACVSTMKLLLVTPSLLNALCSVLLDTQTKQNVDLLVSQRLAMAISILLRPQGSPTVFLILQWLYLPLGLSLKSKVLNSISSSFLGLNQAIMEWLLALRTMYSQVHSLSLPSNWATGLSPLDIGQLQQLSMNRLSLYCPVSLTQTSRVSLKVSRSHRSDSSLIKGWATQVNW